mgnify:CR=1 FL=1
MITECIKFPAGWCICGFGQTGDDAHCVNGLCGDVADGGAIHHTNEQRATSNDDDVWTTTTTYGRRRRRMDDDDDVWTTTTAVAAFQPRAGELIPVAVYHEALVSRRSAGGTLSNKG